MIFVLNSWTNFQPTLCARKILFDRIVLHARWLGLTGGFSKFFNSDGTALAIGVFFTRFDKTGGVEMLSRVTEGKAWIDWTTIWIGFDGTPEWRRMSPITVKWRSWPFWCMCNILACCLRRALLSISCNIRSLPWREHFSPSLLFSLANHSNAPSQFSTIFIISFGYSSICQRHAFLTDWKQPELNFGKIFTIPSEVYDDVENAYHRLHLFLIVDMRYLREEQWFSRRRRCSPIVLSPGAKNRRIGNCWLSWAIGR